jgi:hypothetical protein
VGAKEQSGRTSVFFTELAGQHCYFAFIASAILEKRKEESNTCFCWRPYCVGGPLVAFIPAIACDTDVVGVHAIAVKKSSLIVAGVTDVACISAVSCIQAVTDIPAIAGVLSVPDGFMCWPL